MRVVDRDVLLQKLMAKYDEYKVEAEDDDIQLANHYQSKKEGIGEAIDILASMPEITQERDGMAELQMFVDTMRRAGFSKREVKKLIRRFMKEADDEESKQ